AEETLRELVSETVAAGDRSSALRARLALASLSHERGSFGEAVTLLEEALAGEPFDPASHVDVYSLLARAYTATGQAHAAVELFERCLAEISDAGDAALEARYATLLSYALSDIGEIDRAEQVVKHALGRA